jgi:glycosyltransferase involved in cell wall biosynthesis
LIGQREPVLLLTKYSKSEKLTFELQERISQCRLEIMEKSRNASPRAASQKSQLLASLRRSNGEQKPGSSSLRIGFVSAFPPGHNSLNEFGFHMVSKLAAKNQIDEVFLYADDTEEGRPQPVEGVSPIVCWKFNDPTNLIRLLRAIRHSSPDAVVLNLQFATFGDNRVAGGLGLLLPAALRVIKVPTLVVLHNLADNVDMQDAGFTKSKLVAALMTKAGRLLTRAILRADLVALTIPKYVEFLQSSYGATNVLLAPHGSFEVVPEPSYELPPGNRRIMAFGKWGTYKTVDMLVVAYRDLISRGYEDLELVIAGTDSPNSKGYLAGVAEQCHDLPNITFTGYVAEEDVEGLFSSSVVVVFPYTSTTGSSGVLHQAGAYGCATVLPAIGDFVEVIEEEGFCGEYFDPAEPSTLADAIVKVIDAPDRRRELGRRNYAAAIGIPIDEVVDWHLIHIDRLLTKKQST